MKNHIISETIALLELSTSSPDKIINFAQPISLPQEKNVQYTAGITSINIPYALPNIKAEYNNNTLEYRLLPGAFKTITLVDGRYIESSLSGEIISHIQKNGDLVPYSTPIEFDFGFGMYINTYYEFRFITGDFNQFIGFNKNTYASTPSVIPQDFTPGIRNERYILNISSDLVKGSIVDGTPTSLMMSVNMGSPYQGTPIAMVNYIPENPKYLIINKQFINSIRLIMTNDLGAKTALGGYTTRMTIHIKKLRSSVP